MGYVGSAWALVGVLALGAGCAAGNEVPGGGAGGTGSTTSATSAGGGGQGGSGVASSSSSASSSSTSASSSSTSASSTSASSSGQVGGCGDGVIDPGEECDGADLGGKSCISIGLTGGTLGCTSACKLDDSKCSACGDGMVQPQYAEQCDFDAMGKPLILETCQSLGFTSVNNPDCAPNCRYDITPCLCGNGAVDPAEACDGADLGGKSCVTEGFSAGALACTTACTLDTSACTKCGDGAIDPGEQCDGASFGGKTCITQGFSGGSLGCSPACQILTTGCTTCGNGILEAGEACEGTNLGGKTCASLGFTAGALACSAQCQVVTTGCTKCGNGVLEAGEQCDDGNVTSGDGCGAACQNEVMACDPDGVYAVIMGGPISYSCCSGLVSVNVSSFIFSSNGASIQSAPSNPTTMTGAATTCPSGSFSATASIPGGCTEIYSVQGSFTGPDVWTGTYTISFQGSQCDCFGGAFGTPCVGQAFPITAHR